MTRRHPGARAPRRARRWLAGLTVVVALAAAGAAAAVWWQLRPRPLPPLAAGWDARVSALAGSGISGWRDGAAFEARFSDPFGVAAAPDGTLYVADAGRSQRIRRVGPDGAVSTVAGGSPGYADGPGGAARFDTPSGLALAPDGSLYVADTGNNLIRRLSLDGIVSTAAGALAPGFADGAAREARFNGPIGLAADRTGRLIIADAYNHRIRALLPDGVVVTLAGGAGPGYVDGAAAEARFDTPCGVAVDASGTVYVADSGNGLVRAIADGLVSTLGPLPGDGLIRPLGIAASASGSVYVGDDRGRIVEIVPGRSARVLAGSRPGFSDGPGAEAHFRSPAGLALAADEHLVVVDARNAMLRVVAPASRLQLRPPAPPGLAPRFDADTFAREPLLWPLAPMDGPFEVTGTIGEPRGGEGGERFHAGLDIHAEEGTPVRAVRPGTVTSPLAAGDFGTLNESLRIGPLAYVHVRIGRDRAGAILDPARFVASYDPEGRLTHLRVRRGARFATGDAIGTANAFKHVHLNIGWPGEEYNPLQFRLVQFQDHVPPTIVKGGVKVFREDGTPLTARAGGRLIVEGRVRVVVDAWDQADGNEARRRLGLYRLGYQVLERDGSPAPGFESPRETIRFDRLLPGSEAARIVYASGSGIPFYGHRSTRLLYVVTNTLSGGAAAMGVWDADRLPTGEYTLRVLAADQTGNQAMANRDLPVVIRAATP